MAKRKKKQTQPLKFLLKALPQWILVMIMCVGLCFGVLVECGIIRLSDIQNALGVQVFDRQSDTSALPEEAKTFAVHVLDVGQADSIFITAGGKSLLIDAAERENSEYISSFIRSKGVTHLDYIIATHPHSDHMGGMADIINEFGADKIIIPKLPDEMVPSTKMYENFLLSVKNSGGKLTAAKAGTIYELADTGEDKITLTILSPLEGAEYDDLNDYSVSARIDYGTTSWLFTGDLSEQGEADLVNSGQNIDVTAYKVGHHGSSSSSGSEFLEMVSPRLCVISCGKDNSYGHPHGAALDRLSIYTDKIYRTDISSTVSVYSDGKQLYICTERNDNQ